MNGRNTDFSQDFIRDQYLPSISILNQHTIFKKSSVSASRDCCNPVTVMCISDSRKNNKIVYKKAYNSGSIHSFVLYYLQVDFVIFQCINNIRQNNKQKPPTSTAVCTTQVKIQACGSPNTPSFAPEQHRKKYLSLDHQA